MSQDASHELLLALEKSMIVSPEEWVFNNCVVEHKSGIALWIANIPIVDLSVYRPFHFKPWGFRQRIRLYKTIRSLAKIQLIKALDGKDI